MSKHISRRTMIRQATLITGGVCLCQSILADGIKSTCCDTPEIPSHCYTLSSNSILIDLKKVDALMYSGHAALLVYAEMNFQIIIVRSAEREYQALSRICTHGGNVLSYNNKRNILQCNNYNHSIFDLTGKVVKGPAVEPLHSYPVQLENEYLIVTLQDMEK